MTRKHFTIFVEVCRFLNFSQAAEALNTTQPAVSLAVKELESHYGVALFERMNRRVYLTPAGEALLATAQDVLRGFQEAEETLGQGRPLALRVGANVSFGEAGLAQVLGRFGSSVARSLCELGHEVLAVDRDEKLVEAIAPDVTQAVQANAVDEDALAELGVQNFDAAIVAIGTDIRASILATVLLKEAGVPKVLAKAVDDLHARVLYKVGADRVIFPERDMGQRVARSLVAPNILDLMALSDDDQIAELTLPTDWADKTIVELNIRRNFGVSVLGIHRGGKFLTSPGAETMLMAGDVLLVMGKKEAISAVQ